MTTKKQSSEFRLASFALGNINKALAPVIDAMKDIIGKHAGLTERLYNVAGEQVTHGIPSGIKSTAAREAQTARADRAAAAIFDAGVVKASSPDNIKTEIFARLKASGYIRATAEVSQDEKAEKAKALEAQRSALRRAIAKEKKVIASANANRKFKEGELEELATVKVKEAIAEGKATAMDKAKQEKKNTRALELVEQAESMVAANECGDGDNRELLAAFVVIKASIKALL
jgi:hypothetical protein